MQYTYLTQLLYSFSYYHCESICHHSGSGFHRKGISQAECRGLHRWNTKENYIYTQANQLCHAELIVHYYGKHIILNDSYLRNLCMWYNFLFHSNISVQIVIRIPNNTHIIRNPNAFLPHLDLTQTILNIKLNVSIKCKIGGN